MMVRKIKILMLAGVAPLAFGALGAPGVQAAQFHCHVELCVYTQKPDAGAKTAHHVTIIKRGGESVPTTCNTAVGEAVSSTKTTGSIRIENTVYTACHVAGAAAEVRMNGCDYVVTSAGSFSIICPEGKSIEIDVPATGCVFSIGSQGPLGDVFAHNVGSTAANTTEITLEPKVTELSGNINNKCPIASGAFSEGEYTTGNSLLTGETFGFPAMSNVWWA